MVHRLSRGMLLAAASALLFLILLSAGWMFKAGPALAQGSNVMAVPACQCSAPTSVLGTGKGPSVVHCVCGGLSCAVSMAAGNSSDNHQLQCAR